MNDTRPAGDSLPPFTHDTAGAVLDTHGRISGWTHEAHALLGRSAQDVIGRPARTLLADPASWTALAQAYARGRRRGAAVLRTGRGEDLPVILQAFRLHNGPQGHQGAEAPQVPDEAGTPPECLLLAAPASLATRWHQDQAFVAELFLQDRVGFAVLDPELRLMRTNTHLLPYTGVPSDLRGRRLADFLWPQDAAAVEENLRQVLRTGRPLIGTEQILRTVEDPSAGVIITISAFRLQSPDGQVLGVTALFTDVTELRRSSERLALLHHATASVGRSLSVADTGRELAAALVPGLGDIAVVDIADAVSLGEEPLPDRDGRLLLRRTAVAGHPATGNTLPAPAPVLTAVPTTDPAADGTGTSTGTGTGTGTEGDHSGGADAQAGGHPFTVTAPLRARGTILGRVSVGRRAERGPYQPAEQDLLREITDRAALALDNARRFTREHRAAVGLQRSMLPPAQTDTPAATTAGVYLPADTATGVGGDWFDVIPLSSARIALVVGDVVGHGLAAAATMGRLRTAVRTLADLDLEPDELLTHLDDLVAQLSAEPEQTTDQAADQSSDDDPDGAWHDHPISSATGATCAYAVYDPVTRRCVVASAGHPPPAVTDPEGNVSYLPIDPGPPLGIGGLPFEATEVELAPGSVIALYTDGLIELDHGNLDTGMAELADHLRRPGTLTRPLRDIGRDIVTDHPAPGLGDDLTLLLARTRAIPTHNTADLTIDADPAAVATVRQAATTHLHTWGLQELTFTTELILSELVTNAIRYTTGPVHIRLIHTDRLICEVSDPSATHPRMRRAHLTDEGGRGLYLVAQLTTRWGSRYDHHGKTIWTEQELPPTDAG
ncbi:SpoIIE family protein phosphatase [Streptomyces sp. NPDC047981]|uniref:SpoIIE family protein phosphatase n=1 Tax=Streptomyces sp. NPDC047981 TaxID=3154610 RepID=UPI003427A765